MRVCFLLFLKSFFNRRKRNIR